MLFKSDAHLLRRSSFILCIIEHVQRHSGKGESGFEAFRGQWSTPVLYILTWECIDITLCNNTGDVEMEQSSRSSVPFLIPSQTSENSCHERACERAHTHRMHANV